jgi:hypothetical protein
VVHSASAPYRVDISQNGQLNRIRIADRRRLAVGSVRENTSRRTGNPGLISAILNGAINVVRRTTWTVDERQGIAVVRDCSVDTH